MSEKPVLIKVLVEELCGDFPELTVSKVRYLEAQGLINPKRDKSGYRRYDKADKERLRRILEAQSKQYLPLDVIAAKLDSGDLASSKGKTEKDFVIQMSSRNPELTAAELAKSAKISTEMVKDLGRQSFIGTGPLYSKADLEVILSIKKFMSHGVELRHLKHLKRSADIEVNLVMQKTGFQLQNPEGREKAMEVIADLVVAGDSLRKALTAQALQDVVCKNGKSAESNGTRKSESNGQF